jgi:hypothetical protein
MVLLQVPDVESCRRHLEAVGARVVYEAKGRSIHGLHVHPRDVGGAIVSFDQADPPDSWEWAGDDWRNHVRTSVVTGIAAVELQSTDPGAMAARWAEVLGRPVESDSTISVDGGVIRFVADPDGRGEGVGGIELRAADRARAGERTVVCGTRVTMV